MKTSTNMVTIKKIEIKNYFGRGNFEWNLDPVVNILGGKNGSGKSTIFKMCYAMLNDMTLLASMENTIKKIFKEVTLTFSNDWTLYWPYNSETMRVIFDGDKSSAYIESILVKDDNGKERKLAELQKLVHVYLINSFEQHVAKAAQYEQQPKAQPLDDPTMLDLMIKDQIAIRNQKAIENLMDVSDDDNSRSIESKRIFNLVYTILEKFLKEYDKPFKSSFEFSKNGEKFGYERLSMGEKQILLLLLMVGNINQQPSVFFMDEPDLSMHIDWKEILVKELHELNPNMQIILSTHAPSVITGWRDRVKEVDQLIKK